MNPQSIPSRIMWIQSPTPTRCVAGQTASLAHGARAGPECSACVPMLQRLGSKRGSARKVVEVHQVGEDHDQPGALPAGAPEEGGDGSRDEHVKRGVEDGSQHEGKGGLPEGGHASALGARVKTAKAVTVLLTGPVGAPRVADRRSLALWDPAVPDSRHPHHPALELPEAEAAGVVTRASGAARRASLRALRTLLEELRERGAAPQRIALVVASRTDPDSIANPHMRAHALEGRLFCDLLEEAARNCGLASFVVTERDLFGAAAEALGLPAAELPRRLAELGAAIGPPWRADEKAAALGAWLALAGAERARG